MANCRLGREALQGLLGKDSVATVGCIMSPQIDVHLEPQHATWFGTRVFADAIGGDEVISPQEVKSPGDPGTP